MEDVTLEESEGKLESEVAPALIAVHPTQKLVSVSIGSDLRVFNLEDRCGVGLVDENGGHKDSIRAIRYSKTGKILVSAGDDKLVKVWDTNSCRCIYSVVSEKRVTSVAISLDEMFVCFADKFGVVYVADIRDDNSENGPLVKKKGVPILSHYCSIITRLELSPDGKYIISGDRDFKIRVTIFPNNPLDGAHEIQTFCLGHTEFISSLAFVSSPNNDKGLLVSGSGDSTVRLWDYTSGTLLDTCDVGAKAGLLDRDGCQNDVVLPAVTDLCTVDDGSLVAVGVQSLPGIMLLKCDFSTCTFSVTKVVSIPGESFFPTSISSASSAPYLWMVMGASSNLGKDGSALLVRIRALSISAAKITESNALEDGEIPGVEDLLRMLQGTLSVGEEAFSRAAEAVRTSLRNLLIKKQYSSERRELRKRGRNDKKIQVNA